MGKRVPNEFKNITIMYMLLMMIIPANFRYLDVILYSWQFVGKHILGVRLLY